MIQDIAPHIFENTYSHRAPTAMDAVLFYEGDSVLARVADGILTLPTVADFPDAQPEKLQFLFLEDQVGYYLLEAACAAPEGFSPVSTRDYRNMAPQETAFACAVGDSLRRWYRANRFCGRCGGPMEKSEMERAMVCPACNNTVYPKICPAVIVAVTDGERLLLTKYAGRAFTRYALVAGFAEIGESIEDTVHREVLEEVGLRLKDLRFYKSQPWVFTDSLLMGFYARLDGAGTVTLQESELAEGTWFARSELPDDHNGISLTGEMIETFRSGLDPYSLERLKNT